VPVPACQDEADRSTGETVGQTSQPGVLPMRPLTMGELLDASVALLRTRAGLLITAGFLAAAAEQALLLPLRRLADLDLRYLPADDRWPEWTLLVVVGFATEASAIAGLGGPAAAAAPRALLGRAAPRPERAARPAAATAAVAVVAGAACGSVAATGYAWPATWFLLALVTVPLWIWAYGSLGLAVPAVVVDRLGPARAIRRSVRLSSRSVLRTVRIRVLGYAGWFTVRLAWGTGALSLVGLVYTSPDTTMDALLISAVYLVVNALAYPMLACLDAVLHLEARIRTEGLDIALRQALHRGVETAPLLAAP
jgi:hypothetical protein